MKCTYGAVPVNYIQIQYTYLHRDRRKESLFINNVGILTPIS